MCVCPSVPADKFVRMRRTWPLDDVVSTFYKSFLNVFFFRLVEFVTGFWALAVIISTYFDFALFASTADSMDAYSQFQSAVVEFM